MNLTSLNNVQKILWFLWDVTHFYYSQAIGLIKINKNILFWFYYPGNWLEMSNFSVFWWILQNLCFFISLNSHLISDMNNWEIKPNESSRNTIFWPHSQWFNLSFVFQPVEYFLIGIPDKFSTPALRFQRIGIIFPLCLKWLFLRDFLALNGFKLSM